MNNKQAKIVTFGEIIMRLTPPEKHKMQQAQNLEFTFGGTELNVGASLAILQHEVFHVGVVPKDFVGDCALRFVNGLGVNTSYVCRNDYPLGQYIFEEGAGMRAGQISYNRLDASFAHINPADYDWDEIFKDADCFHWTGITPGISENALITLKEALAVAKNKNVIISVDPTFRSNLWKYGKDGYEVLKEIVPYSNVFFGNVSEINFLLDSEFTENEEGFKKACEALSEKMPNIQKIFGKIRTDYSATHHAISGQAYNGEFFSEDPIEITDIVDRIGTGDAFAAGVIHGLLEGDDRHALQFGLAACAIKHTIPKDINLAHASEIEEIMKGNHKGRLKR